MISFVLFALSSLTAGAAPITDCFGRTLNESSRLAPALDQPKGCAGPSIATIPASFSFAPYKAVATSSWADAVAIGDINGDRKLDAVLSTTFYFDADADYKAFIFPQQANGLLGAPTKLSYGQTANRNGIAVSQLDGAFGLDIAIGGAQGVSVLYSNGLGGFRSPIIVGSRQANLLATSTFAFNQPKEAPSIIISVGWSNEGEYMFPISPLGSYSVSPWAPAAQGYNGIAAGDLDGDTLLDIAVSSGQGVGQNLSWYKNTGKKLLQLGALNANCDVSFSSANAVAFGNINADKYKDLIVVGGGNRPTSCVLLFAGNANGFGAPTRLASYDIPDAVVVKDVDRNGLDDIVVTHGGWGSLGVYLQQTPGNIDAERLFPIPYASHYNPQGLAIGDVSGDGCPDAVIADYNNGLVTLNGQGCQ